MKRVFTVFFAFMFVFCAIVLSSCGARESDFTVTDETANIDYSKYSGITLNVYNWGEYISDGTEGSVDVNYEFTKLTGINVNYTNFSSNEDMYSKLKSGGSNYDIIIPSDYMIEQLIAENMIQKLDFSRIPNYKYIDERYKALYYDPANEYSVPYNCGMVGVIYNTELVNYTPDGYDVLWDENLKDQILMINNPRDAFGIAQFKLGIDVNTTDEAELEKAKDELLKQKSLVKAYVMDEIYNKMESGAAAVATYYAGDFLSMYCNNDKLAFVYPKEGANIFVDAVCIPVSSEHKEAAELYINFLCDPKVAVCNAEKICYRSPNTAVVENEEYQEFLADLHPDVLEIMYPDLEKLYPGVDTNAFYFHRLPSETLSKMSALWSELKISTTEDSDSGMLYWISGAFIVVIVCLFVFIKVRKSKRENEQ